MELEEEARSFINVWLTVLACVCYCYFVSSNLPPGKLRFFSLLPVFSLFAALPLRLSTVLPTGITAFFVTWLASFKLLLFSFDKGPLSSNPGFHPHPSGSLFLFILFTCFPINIRQPHEDPSPKTPKLPLNLPSKLLLSGISILVHEHQDKLLLQAHPKLVLLLYLCMLYLYVDMIMGISNAAARAVLGVELQMPSDEPYLSTSLQDFWGRRWNLTVTNSLRHTVYKPLKSFLEPRLGTRWAAAGVAVMAAFLVSGLMHELIYYYVTRARPTWEVTGFFVLQGACVVVEAAVKAAVGKRWRVSRMAATPLTVGFVAATAMWLFFPQLIRNGTTVRAIEECKALVEGLGSLPLVEWLKPKF